MSAHDATSVDRAIADALDRRADEMGERLVSELLADVGVRSANQLPIEALRDHLPRVVRRVAEFLRTPADTTKSNMADRLALHARLRREQGYDVEELLIEYERLARLVTEAAMDAVREQCADTDPVEVAGVFTRLHDVLTTISAVTVATYRTEELERQHELASRLAEFGRTLAHELKDPLGAAESGTHMLREERIAERPASRDRFIELILKSLRRARDLVDDIRVLALSESSQVEVDWQPVRRLIRAVVDELDDVAERNDVRMDIAEPIPDIEVPARAFEIALINLLGNAIKYSDREEPERWARISVERGAGEHWPEGESVRVEVADNGLGIRQDLQPRIFQRRFRAHPGVAEGTGLGLSIARQVVERHGGRIDFTSEEGEGSTFWFTAPARSA